MPFIYRYLVDNFNSLTVKSFVVIIALYGIAKIGAIIFNNISFFLSEKAINPAHVDVKVKVFSHLQNLDFAFHVNKKSGELISKIKRGGSAFENINQDVNRELIDDLFRLAMAAAVFP